MNTSKARLLERRRERIGPSLSLAYREPLKIVRGSMQYLYDEQGRQYLDCVNNVCHVGHCHPRVVAALQHQIAQLNTNTRYLHDNLVEYAERLCATLPDSLEVCYLVCSGSEANELAIRLAKTYTGSTDFVVLDTAYHGNTSGLVDISPYKFWGAGGSGRPAHVQTVPTPDVYRGRAPRWVSVAENDDRFRDSGTAGQAYAEHVAASLHRIGERGAGVAAFFCESLPGCGGQLLLPQGYLRDAYDQIRHVGGVCVADEVQVGFGRVGATFWGFELQGVVPDIVTLGKPIGNGHPLGAVVTTRAIADAFDNGMEYFNTFGGNPVSCAAGLTVLDVIAEEHLQERALDVGGHLLDQLEDVAKTHHSIGDVRGAGLFVGVELVTDRETRAPATAGASLVVERMKDRGVLLSTDGPHDNVLKIKPPLVFGRHDTNTLVSALRAVLREIEPGILDAL